MDLEKLDELMKLCRNRSIDDFFDLWRDISLPKDAANDTSRANAAQVTTARVDTALIEDYVARLQSPRDADAALTGIGSDKRLRARECIEIAARLAPGDHRPRSRNRALQAIRRSSCPTTITNPKTVRNIDTRWTKPKPARRQTDGEPRL